MWYRLFLLFLVAPVHSEREGSACVNEDGSAGTCTLMPNCAVGLKMLRTSGVHNLYRCGFSSFNEIVCCPDLVDTSTSTTTSSTSTTSKTTKKKNKPPQTRGQLSTRKSVIACEGFVKTSGVHLTWHIINGVDAYEGEFPHMAALGYDKQSDGVIDWDCGGALIAPRFVLTAGHCVYNVNQVLPSKVRMGTINLTSDSNPNQRDFDVEDHHVHPQFRRRERLHDIAILRLKQTVEFTEFIQPACLYTENTLPKILTITGWGVINSDMKNSWGALQKATISESNMGECKEIYKARVQKVISENQICAADKSKVNTTDTCQGDSGGPLQVENRNSSSLFSIVGVTSYGMGCGSNFPSIYTRVAAYLDFIEDYVWPD